MHKDADLIKKLGGAIKLSRRLGFDEKNGPFRIRNWNRRGIPNGIKIQFPDIFLADLVNKSARKRKG